MRQPDLTTPQLILFDLGGVLMDFSGLARLAEITGRKNDAALRDQWASNRWLQAYERGRCTGNEFASGVVADWKLPLTPNEFLAEFASWPAGPFVGTIELLHRLSGQISMACLSNTNPTHWQQHLERWGVVDHFEWTFVSHELDILKPDPEIYRHVIASLNRAPDQVLFLDDVEENIAAATRHGIHAVQVRGIDQVTATISRNLPWLEVDY